MAGLERQLSRALARLRPLLERRAFEDLAMHRLVAFTPERDAAVTLKGDGPALHDAIEAVLRAEPAVASVWGEESRFGFVQDAVSELVAPNADVAAVAHSLATRALSKPERRVIVLPLYGVIVDMPCRIGGLDLRHLDATGLSDHIGWDTKIADLAPSFRTLGLEGTLAFSESATDDEIAGTTADWRADVALCVLAALNEELKDRPWPLEFWAGLHERSTSGRIAVSENEVGFGRFGAFGEDRVRQPLRAAEDFIIAARSARAGLTVLDALAEQLPSRSPSPFEWRLLRAARSLRHGLEGDSGERFLWRWRAIEALLGDAESEIGDRLAERMVTVIEDEPVERPRRKRELKTLYGRRSALVHGSDDAAPPPRRAIAFGVEALSLLERVAAAPVSSPRELFDRIDAAKFQGLPFGSENLRPLPPP
jgi:hypothetical protein